MDADLDTLATALYVTTDDLLTAHPDRVPPRPRVGIAPQISDAELLTLAVMQALLQFTSEARWLRYATTHLLGMFPHLPQQPGYNKRLRKLAGTMARLVGELGAQVSVAHDDVWVADSTPVECGRSRETAKRSDLAGWAEYGYCASHSRYFWGLRLHLVATVHGLPLGWAVSGAKADERVTCWDLLTTTPALTHQLTHPVTQPVTQQQPTQQQPTQQQPTQQQPTQQQPTQQQPTQQQPTQTLIADKGYYGAGFESDLAEAGITLLRPARKGEQPRDGERYFKPSMGIDIWMRRSYTEKIDPRQPGSSACAQLTTHVSPSLAT